MSLINPRAKNPATRFIKWKGGADAITTKDENGKKSTEYEGGKATWWDKDTKSEYEIDLPFPFTVLEQCITITGYQESTRSGYYANEVQDLNDTLVVRTKAGIVAKGKYANIKDKLKAMGAKYTQSVYIAFKDDSGELVIGNIQFSGASLTPWIEFQKEFDVERCAVKMDLNPEVKKKGKVYFFVPSFEGLNLNADTLAEAKKLGVELDHYLSIYFTQKSDVDDDLELDDVEDDEDEDDTDIHNIKGLDDQDDPEEDDEAEAEEEVAPKKRTTKKAAKSNVSDVEF